MKLKRIQVSREVHGEGALQGRFLLGDALEKLDALAKEGVRFDRVYTGQPVCGPARSLLFTGLYPHENGSWGNSMPLGADVKTLGQRLSERNIPCAYIGKWHLDGGDYFGNGICPDGWDKDYWYDMKCYLDELGSDAERFRSRDSGSKRPPLHAALLL